MERADDDGVDLEPAHRRGHGPDFRDTRRAHGRRRAGDLADLLAGRRDHRIRVDPSRRVERRLAHGRRRRKPAARDRGSGRRVRERLLSRREADSLLLRQGRREVQRLRVRDRHADVPEAPDRPLRRDLDPPLPRRQANRLPQQEGQHHDQHLDGRPDDADPAEADLRPGVHRLPVLVSGRQGARPRGAAGRRHLHRRHAFGGRDARAPEREEGPLLGLQLLPRRPKDRLCRLPRRHVEPLVDRQGDTRGEAADREHAARRLHPLSLLVAEGRPDRLRTGRDARAGLSSSMAARRPLRRPDPAEGVV